MLLRLFIVTQTILSLVFSSSNLRLKEIEKLIDKFNSELDINYLFYDKIREQKGNPLLCSSELGPHCHLINDQSLLDKVDFANDTHDIQMRKAAIVRDWDQIHLQEKSTGAFYVVSNKHDVALGRETKKTLPRQVDVLITFEHLPVGPKDTLISDTLWYKYNQGFQLDKSGKKETGDWDVRVTFEKLYVPEENQVYNKKSMHDAQEVAGKKETELKEIEPTEIYIHTKKDEEGLLIFSRPVVIHQIYARKHNYVHYENERKAQGKSTRAEHTLTGRFVNIDAVEFNGNAFSNVNKWVRVIPKKQDEVIDRLVIPANTDIDNILFTVFKAAEPKTLFTAEDLQDFSQFLSGRLPHYQTITDPKLIKKIIREDVEKYLYEQGFQKETIEKMMNRIDIMDAGNGQYNIMIGDTDDLVDIDFPAGVEVLDLKNAFGGDPEKLQELKDKVLKELEKKGLADEDMLKELNTMLGTDTVTASTKQQGKEEKKKDEVGESRIKKN